jgi:hypothetical protein
MRGLWIVGLALVACGPSYGGQGVKTPDELVDEQLAQSPGESKEGRSSDGDYSDNKTDEEKRKEFDERQADLEMKRTTRSAATCGGVVAGGPRGTAEITVVFSNNGRVKEASLAPPFADTDIGACVLQAYKKVIVPAFVGPEKTMPWKVEVLGEPPAEKTTDKPKKK